jgi:hypothetical protein
MSEELHEASRAKPNGRATRAEMEERASFLIDYAERHNPVTVRQLYYRAEVEGMPGIDKTEAGYDKTQRQVLLLRRAGRLPYEHIADLTRWRRKPRTYNSVQEALYETARLYRKALWHDAGVHLEIWCEKDALAGVIFPVTSLYDVPLMVARGFSSETFCFEAVEEAAEHERPYHVSYLGDFDRSGLDAAEALQEKLERFGAERGVEVRFIHLAIKKPDILEVDHSNWRVRARVGNMECWLPTRPHKRKSRADQLWPHPFACELDAIEPDDLRALVRWAIEYYLPPDQLELLQSIEASERQLINGLVGLIATEQKVDDDEDTTDE